MARHLSSVESLEENKQLTCNIPSYPLALTGHSSTTTTSGILVCGGQTSSGEYRKDCYEYRVTSNSWRNMPPMTTERSLFGMIYLKQKVYAVGGNGGSGSKNSMEIYDPNNRTWTKQSIPFSVYHHCITTLSANQFIVIGGYHNGVSKNVMTKKCFNPIIHFLHFTAQNIFTNFIFKFQESSYNLDL